ncbi:MAG: nucleotide exchange factor GrpE [Planctomycetota bacterium]
MKMKEKKREKKDVEVDKSKLEEPRSQIVQLQKEKDEIFAQLQRVSADYANYQKRASKQISDTITYEKERIIKSLLPVLDNFEHTLANAHSAERTEDFLKGVKIIYDQMLDFLKSHGVEQIEAQGEKFDPALHQAMMRKSEPEQEEDVVLEEFQKGYKLGERVIRPSRVIVNKLSAEKGDEVMEEEEGKKDLAESPDTE